MSEMSINTSNLSAMLQLNLFRATNSMNLSALRMSTGFKLNSVGDDASTYMIASGIQQSIRGWQGAQESTQKGISIVNTARNSLSNMKSILNQLSGIADTALSSAPGADKTALQAKAKKLLEQLYNQKNTTRFDGVKIFGDENNSNTLTPGGTSTETTQVTGTTTTVKTTQTIGTTTTVGTTETIGTSTTIVTTETVGTTTTIGTTETIGTTTTIRTTETIGTTTTVNTTETIGTTTTIHTTETVSTTTTFGTTETIGTTTTIRTTETVSTTTTFGTTETVKTTTTVRTTETVGTTTTIKTTETIGTTTTIGTITTEIVKEVINGLIKPITQMSLEELKAAGYTAITSAADFKTKIEANLGGKFALFGNLDFSGVSHTAIEGFSGELNGNGFAIKNLTMNDPDKDNQGLFGTLNTGSVVKNLIIQNANISGYVVVGALAGIAEIAVAVENVAVIGGTVTETALGGVTIAGAGGLIGLVNNAFISNSWASANVSGLANVGGLVGGIINGTIENSYATLGNVNGEVAIGGLVGYTEGSSTIRNSWASGEVRGQAQIGGLVGNNQGVIKNSYAIGYVIGETEIGGLVGFNKNSVTNCYAKGAVIAERDATSGYSYAGGLIGRSSYTGTITNTYATGNVSGTGSYVGGLIGYADGAITNSYAKGEVTAGEDLLKGYSYAGGLVGYTFKAISNCFATGATSASSDYVGGLVGETLGTISNSYATGTTTSSFGALTGGLAGAADTIINSYATGQVAGGTAGGLAAKVKYVSTSYATGEVKSRGMAGGLVAFLDVKGTVSNSYATGDVYSASANGMAGGFIGSVFGSIRNSWASGNVYGGADKSSVGGFVGLASGSGSINNCYAKGALAGGGGFAGTLHSSIKVNNSYYNIASSDDVMTGSSLGITGLSLASLDAINTKVVNNEFYIPTIQKSESDISLTSSTYIISTAQELASYASAVSLGYQSSTVGMIVILTADIDMTGINYSSIKFEGTLDGNGHTIKNLKTSLFTEISSTGIVKDLILENVNISVNRSNVVGALANNNYGIISNILAKNVNINTTNSAGSIGGLVGVNNLGGSIFMSKMESGTITLDGFSSFIGGLVGDNNGTIEQSSSKISIQGTEGRGIGGFVGWNSGTIKDSSSSAGSVSVTTAEHVGGFLGQNSGGEIERVGSDMTVNVSGQSRNIGGLIGWSLNGTVSDSTYSGTVDARLSNSVGGLIGLVDSTGILGGSSTGDLFGYNDIGGLIGVTNSGSNISESYSEMNVQGFGSIAGGFIGKLNQATISNAYATGNVTSYSGVGGFVGQMTNNAFIGTSYAKNNINISSSGDTVGTGTIGGFAGIVMTGARISNGFWDKNSSGITKGCGFTQAAGTIVVTGLTTSQFAVHSNLTGFFDSSNLASPWYMSDEGAPKFIGTWDHSQNMEHLEAMEPPRWTVPITEGSIAINAGLSSPIVDPQTPAEIKASTTQKSFTTLTTGTTVEIFTTLKTDTTLSTSTTLKTDTTLSTSTTVTVGTTVNTFTTVTTDTTLKAFTTITVGTTVNTFTTVTTDTTLKDFTTITTDTTLSEFTTITTDTTLKDFTTITIGTTLSEFTTVTTDTTLNIFTTITTNTTREAYTTLSAETTEKIFTTEKILTTIIDGTPIVVKNGNQETSIYTSFNAGNEDTRNLDTGMTFGKIYFDISDDSKTRSSKAVIESIMKKINAQENKLNNYLNDLSSAVQLQKDNIKMLDDRFASMAITDMDAEEINYTQNQLKIQNISAIMAQTARMRYAPILMLLGKY